MKLSFLHFADYAFLTDNGKLSVVGIFDRIGSKSFPTTHGLMFVVGQVSEIAKENDLQLHIQKGNNTILQSDIVTNLQEVITPLKSYNFMIGLQNFVFSEPGIYDFIVKNNDEESGRKKLALEKPAEGN